MRNQSPATFPETCASFFLAGPEGQLEVESTWPKELASVPAVAIVCHPHPMYGGTMRNKVVTTLVKTMQALGLATVRFNYRGVGESDGSYGHVHGEVEDLLAVKTWVRRVLPGVPLWLLGFSFGAFVAAMGANGDDGVQRLITVAPAVEHAEYAYPTLTDIHCPWLVIHGDNDEIASCDAVREFAANPPSPLALVTLPDTTHFFHGRLAALREAVLAGCG